MKYNQIILFLMSIISNNRSYRPHSIGFFKRDLSLKRDYHTLAAEMKKQTSFSYQLYQEALDVWEKQKLKRRIRTHSLFDKRGMHKTLVGGAYDPEDAEIQGTSRFFSETINHDGFPYQNSKKAIFRLKLNKNSESTKRRMFKMDMQANTADLKIIKKNFSLHEQKQAKLHPPLSPLKTNVVNRSKFYLLNRSRPKANVFKLSQQFETLQSINQITPW